MIARRWRTMILDFLTESTDADGISRLPEIWRIQGQPSHSPEGTHRFLAPLVLLVQNRQKVKHICCYFNGPCASRNGSYNTGNYHPMNLVVLLWWLLWLCSSSSSSSGAFCWHYYGGCGQTDKHTHKDTDIQTL